MNQLKVLIVEDELLIAETIKLFVEERNHMVVGMAISYDEAIKLIEETTPDLVLLDIRLYGQKSGLDVALFLQNNHKSIAYIIVSSQYDSDYIERAMKVGASGYITKPISKETLWSSMELAALMHKGSHNEKFIDIKISHGLQRIKLNEIEFIKSDHVYVDIICQRSKYVGRYSLGELLDLIDHPDFVQCHRSYIINTNLITRYNSYQVWINHYSVPISTSFRDIVLAKLQTLSKPSTA
jgi:DNA-binding LytR/AlgR family response regulator